MKKISLAIIMVILLSACSASKTSENQFLGLDFAEAPMSAPAASAPEVMYDREMGEIEMTGAAAQDSGFGTDTTANTSMITGKQPDVSLTDPNRKLIYTASLNVETLSFEESISNLESLCASFQGFIENSSISGMSITTRGKQFRNANYTFRIPSKRYNEFVSSIGTIGNLTNKSQYTEDISSSYYDVESRLKVLEMRRDRLFDLLEKETSSKAIIEFENSLSETLYEIEQMTGTLKRYDSLVDYSTVNVYLNEVEAYTEITEYKPAPQTVGERIKSAFGSSAEDIGNFLVDVFVFLVGNILYVLICIAVITVCVIIVRKNTKHMRKIKQKPTETKENDEKGES